MKRKKKEEETDWIMYPLSEDSRVAFDGIAQGKRFISIDGSNLREEEEKKNNIREVCPISNSPLEAPTSYLIYK